MPAFCPPGGQYAPAAGSFHPGAEAVGFRPASPVRLKSSFRHELLGPARGQTSIVPSASESAARISVYQWGRRAGKRGGRFAGGIGVGGGCPAAALNQDQSVNSEANPASYGSIVTIYATGFGITDPPLNDGQISLDRLPAPWQTVAVELGLEPLEVLYAGQAPGLVAGVMQVNFRLPAAGNQGEGETSLLLRVGQAAAGFSLFVAP